MRRASRYISIQSARPVLFLCAILGLAASLVSTGSPSVHLIFLNFTVSLVAVLGLNVFSGNSGILSFGHVGFLALGAQISATLTMPSALKTSALPLLPDFLQTAELGLWSATAITLVVVALVAALVAIPICRLGGAASTIATLGLLIIINSLIVGAQGVTRGSQAMYGVPRLISIPTAMIFVIAALVLARLYRDSIPGLKMRAARENEAAAMASGINVRAQRYIAFVLSAVICAMAGIVFAHTFSVFSAKSFYLDMMFAQIVMLVVGGIGSITGAIFGTTAVLGISEILRRLEHGFDFFGLQVPQIFGLTVSGLSLTILVVLYFRRSGIVGDKEIEFFLPFLRQKLKSTPAIPASNSIAPQILVLNAVEKRFGGLIAVDNVSLQIRTGEVLGLIGPNGSGKTTLLGCIAGTHPLSSGSVELDGRRLSGLPAHRVARFGLSRSFQTVRLFARLSVLENVKTAMAQREAGLGQAELDSRSLALLAELRIADLAEREAGTLAYGQQRRLEVARALAAYPSFLLLDEPAAGMNEVETVELLDILRRLVRTRGIGMVIVDHDMHLIVNLCDRVAVLNKGQIIAEGDPLSVTRDPRVQEAYLGRRAKEKAKLIQPTGEHANE